MYSSHDMKVGINTPELGTFAGFLLNLMALDDRGGFFKQIQMVSAVRTIAAMEQHSEVFAGFCALKGHSFS